jgi:hypothetical protein
MRRKASIRMGEVYLAGRLAPLIAEIFSADG